MTPRKRRILATVGLLLAFVVLGAMQTWVAAHLPQSLLLFALRLALVMLPLAALASWLKIVPHRPLVYLAIIPVLVSLGLWQAESWYWALVMVDVGVVLFATVDLFSLPKHKHFHIQRDHSRAASLGKPQAVQIWLSNTSPREWMLLLRDGLPHELRPEPDEFMLRIAPRSRAQLKYDIRPQRRGAFHATQAYLRVRSRFGLWTRILSYDVPSTLHVYPDMQQLREYALLARRNRLNLMGLRRSRRIGQDNEFERLRDYTLDDNFKRIDWRSSARRNKLTVRDYQANQSQRVIFMIDCGRMMTNEAAGLSLLDHAFNAMLMLSYVALNHGDKVGLLLFSDEIHTYIPPAGGQRHMNRLLHAAFDRFPRRVESRYDEAFLYLGSHCRKRSLVVLITNVIDEVNSLQVQQYLANIAGQHLPLGVLLRDRPLFQAVEQHATSEQALFEAAAAADILAWRHRVIADLNGKGVLSVDVFPEDLTAPLVNRYLDVKARHLL
ncbi:MAG: DUF58 domain-containing protein [Planctomycetaceae bacterium]|nr:DUF58 domain-containing protein [Planctomycetaceae bacterium]